MHACSSWHHSNAIDDRAGAFETSAVTDADLQRRLTTELHLDTEVSGREAV